MKRRDRGEWGFKPLKKWYQSNKRGEVEKRQWRKERESFQI